MANRAKKLPSGRWRTLTDYYDDSGKRHFKSFTADTKKESEALAAAFNNKQNAANFLHFKKTVRESIAEYISTKDTVLSPSTIKGYESCMRAAYKEIEDIPINMLTEQRVQKWINKYAKTHSPKSVRNAFGLLSAVLTMNRQDDCIAHITLPQAEPSRQAVPSDDEIKMLLSACKGTQLESAILLGAFCPLRRGEICALTRDDFTDTTVTVDKALVSDGHGNWILKSPKTLAGYRTVDLPQQTIKTILSNSGDKYIYEHAPDYLTKQFIELRDKLGLRHIHFHSLRHYGASALHYIGGVSDLTIMSRGGWATDTVMKRIYRGEITEETKKESSLVASKILDMTK